MCEHEHAHPEPTAALSRRAALAAPGSGLLVAGSLGAVTGAIAETGTTPAAGASRTSRLTQQEAERRILRAGFEPSFRDDTTSTEPKGTVTDQIPAAGETADQGATITVFVSVFEEPTTTTPPPTSPTTPVPTSPVTPPTPGAAVTPSGGRNGNR